MNNEESIKQQLIEKFGYLTDKIRLQRARRIFVELNLENFSEVFDFAVRQLQFNYISAITGLDEQPNLSFIYHLANDAGIMLNIKVSAPRANPVIKTVTSYFPSAEIYEREIVDLLGAKVEGLPAGNRYPLTDNWPTDQFPLRKDWNGGSHA